MNGNEYQQLAMKTLNPKLEKRDILSNAVMGLCGEAGEAIDLVKKSLYQDHPFEVNAFIKELGDIAWYLAEAATAVNVSLDEIFERNIEKLKQRFPQGFTQADSLNRKDEK